MKSICADLFKIVKKFFALIVHFAIFNLISSL